MRPPIRGEKARDDGEGIKIGLSALKTDGAEMVARRRVQEIGTISQSMTEKTPSTIYIRKSGGRGRGV